MPAARLPRICWVVRPTTTAPEANSAAWANSRDTGDDQTQYSGARSAVTGLKWSPSMWNPGPLMSTTGARNSAYARTDCPKIPRSQEGVRKWVYCTQE